MKSLKGKEKLEVAFFLTIPGMWKADYLFKLMQELPDFHPYIVILPYSSFKNFSKEETFVTVKRTEEFIRSKGFEYIIPYDEEKGKWFDIKSKLDPDIVFFSSPYKDNLPEYYLYHYLDKGTFYIPYGFTSMNCYNTNYNLVFPNLVGCHLVETDMHVSFAKKYGRSNGKNYAVVGCPGAEVYLRKDYNSPDVWKPQDTIKKKIIWAPHHSIDGEGGLNVSTFLTFCDAMLDIANKFKDKVQFAFKPHQTLKFKLEILWGTEKTQLYYHQWETLSNCQLVESGYSDLFIHSDAMIHDSGSFTTEYLFVNKPVMYLVKNDVEIRNQFNDFGIKAFDQHYKGKTLSDIENFIEEVVIAGNDPMKSQRQQFFAQYLASKDGKLPSECIVEYIQNLIHS